MKPTLDPFDFKAAQRRLIQRMIERGEIPRLEIEAALDRLNKRWRARKAAPSAKTRRNRVRIGLPEVCGHRFVHNAADTAFGMWTQCDECGAFFEPGRRR